MPVPTYRSGGGGLPIIRGGKILGGIRVSGVTSDQDEQIAKAGADLVK